MEINGLILCKRLYNIYKALDTVEVKGYKNVGTFFNCMQEIQNIVLQLENDLNEENIKCENKEINNRGEKIE